MCISTAVEKRGQSWKDTALVWHKGGREDAKCQSQKSLKPAALFH